MIASSRGNLIGWYANDGTGIFGQAQLISSNRDGRSSVVLADLDGDGDLDALSSSTGLREVPAAITWFENTDGKGTFGDSRPIDSLTPYPMFPELVIASDLDGDDDLDAVAVITGNNGNQFVWYENIDGQGTFSERKIIDAPKTPPQSAFAADLDGDGDSDILSATLGGSFVSPRPSEIGWYENLDGNGNFSQQRLLHSSPRFGRAAHAVDVDGDGDSDVVTVFRGLTAWHENIDGAGSFGPEQIIAEESFDNSHAIDAADFNGDGGLDILTGSNVSQTGQEIAWYKNTNGHGTFGERQPITAKQPDGASWVDVKDLDGDGDLDLLASSAKENWIGWYKNDDGNGTFGERNLITTNLLDPRSIFGSDIDGDGDVDALSASAGDNKIAWYDNVDGKGMFGDQTVITTDAAGAQSVFAIDIDGDGDMDVISASESDHKIAWYENTDGLGTFGDQVVITTNAAEAQSVFCHRLGWRWGRGRAFCVGTRR